MSSTPLTHPPIANPEPDLTSGRLSSGVLGTSDIVFMVMAAAAPMGVVVTLLPMAFAFGNGGGVPGTYLGATAAMLLFAIGYVRIIPFVQNAGAFYAYIAASVGRIWGLAAAYVAAFSYFALSASTLSAMAYFCELLFERLTGLKLHWSVWAFGGLVLACGLSYHRITLAATVLGVALAAEVALMLFLHYAGTRQQLLQKKHTWCSDRASMNRCVTVGALCGRHSMSPRLMSMSSVRRTLTDIGGAASSTGPP